MIGGEQGGMRQSLIISSYGSLSFSLGLFRRPIDGVEHGLHLGKDRFRAGAAIDFAHQILNVVVLNDGQRIVEEGVEALLQRFEVVVGAAASLGATLQAALDANVFRAVEHENELQIGFVLHLFGPAVEIVLVARETVDEEFILAGFLVENNKNII